MTWQTTSIAAIAEVVTKGTTPTTYGMPFTDEGVNFVKAEALNGDAALDHGGFAHVSEDTHLKLARSILKEGDVLVTIAGANVGQCGLVRASDLPANTNQAVGIIRVDTERAHPKFVYYHFKNPTTFAFCQSLGGQAAQPNINLTVLKGFSLRVPDIDEQIRIAATLSAYDDLIENNRRRIALLEDAARQLYKEWFVRFRFPGHEHVKIVDGVPEGWEPRQLSDCVDVVKDAADPKALEPDTPYIGLEHLPRRSITLGEWETAEKVESGKFRFRERDIIFGKIRPYFHKVGFALTEGITSSDAIVMRAKDVDLWAAILMEVSSDRFVALASQTVKEGSKMPRANWDVLKKHILAIPPEGLREIFSDQIDAIASQTKALSLAISNAARARDLLLPKLMNGTLTV